MGVATWRRDRRDKFYRCGMACFSFDRSGFYLTLQVTYAKFAQVCYLYGARLAPPG